MQNVGVRPARALGQEHLIPQHAAVEAPRVEPRFGQLDESTPSPRKCADSNRARTRRCRWPFRSRAARRAQPSRSERSQIVRAHGPSARANRAAARARDTRARPDVPDLIGAHAQAGERIGAAGIDGPPRARTAFARSVQIAQQHRLIGRGDSDTFRRAGRAATAAWKFSIARCSHAPCAGLAGPSRQARRSPARPSASTLPPPRRDASSAAPAGFRAFVPTRTRPPGRAGPFRRRRLHRRNVRSGEKIFKRQLAVAAR